MMRRLSSGLPRAAAACALIALPALALAHPGHEGIPMHATDSFLQGVQHPLTGLDHLAAMVSVGVWSAMSARSLRQAAAAPLAFAALLLVGALLGLGGVTFPATEQMIAASLLVLGVLVSLRVRMPAAAGAALVGAFALFHGTAHGAELPATAAAAWYVGGFMMATVALHVAGMGLGRALERTPHAGLARYAGAAVGLYGVALLAG